MDFDLCLDLLSSSGQADIAASPSSEAVAQGVVASAPLSATRQHFTTWTTGSYMMFARIPILGMRVTCVYICAHSPPIRPRSDISEGGGGDGDLHPCCAIPFDYHPTRRS